MSKRERTTDHVVVKMEEIDGIIRLYLKEGEDWICVQTRDEVVKYLLLSCKRNRVVPNYGGVTVMSLAGRSVRYLWIVKMDGTLRRLWEE